MTDFKNRKKMMNQFQPVATVKTIEDIYAYLDDKQYYNNVEIETMAVSYGAYGANGAILSVYASNSETGRSYVMAINERNTFLLEQL